MFYPVVKVVLWSGGAHLTKPGWSKPHTHSNPTDLALFRHKITLYRFNQGAHTIAGGSNGSRGAEPPTPLTLTTSFIIPNLVVLGQTVRVYVPRFCTEIGPSRPTYLSRSPKVIWTDTDQSATYDFLYLVIHSNSRSLAVSKTNNDFGRKSYFPI